MNDSGKRLGKLVELARRGRPAEEAGFRPGFSTRVAARWSGARDEEPDLLSELLRLGRWGLALAVVVLAISLFVHRPAAPERPDVLSAFAGIESPGLPGI